ncbi:restriction endonuclease subunit S [Vibrio metschnikovii]|uniref:restriction endonuclease subunit S n=1 Tax=Vibrio metschnikovii TaxID=28172 RepID=UPI002FCCA2F6
MGGRYKAYPEYKESGVEWVGKIPSHWGLKKLKYLAPLISEKAREKTNPIALEHIQSWTGKLIPTDSMFDGDGTKFKAGDILFGKLRPYLAKVYLTEEDGEAIGDFHVMRPTNSSYGKFLKSLMLTTDYISTVDASTYGAKMPRASWDFTSNIQLPFCSETEIEKITQFLDHETAKIDTLIAKQEKLIELLKEKRQAVISHAVTKGLNPDAPMKDSGVEWLGEVPEHWEVTRAKFVSKIFVPQRNKPELNSNNIGTPWATMDDMKSDFILSTHHTVSDEALKSAGSKVLPKGSVIASCVGNFGVASINKIDVVINQQLQAYIPKRISTLYLRELVSISKCYFELVGTAATLVYVNQQGFENLPITLPSIEEQQDITDYLTAQKGKFDKLIGKCFNQVELMKERKTALISAAVTGKIDVRHFVAEQGQPQGAQG